MRRAAWNWQHGAEDEDVSNNMIVARLVGSLLAVTALAGVARAQVDTAPSPSTQQTTTTGQQAPASQQVPAQQTQPQPAPEKPQSVWDLLKSGQALAEMVGEGISKGIPRTFAEWLAMKKDDHE